MAERQQWWRRKRPAGTGASEAASDRPVVPFRSDNDLYEWRVFWPAGSALTAFSVSLVFYLHVSFAYSPVAVVPAALLYLFMRWYSARARKAGRRFSAYQADDLL